MTLSLSWNLYNFRKELILELSKHYGLVPDVETVDMVDINSGQYEIVKISSLGGVIWVANRVDKLESPRYFKTMKEMKKFKSGWHDNE